MIGAMNRGFWTCGSFADFVAAAIFGEPRNIYLVVGATLGEPRNVDFVGRYHTL